MSQPEIPTKPSYWCARIIISIESAIISLLTKDAFIPSCPIAIPSDTAIAVNSLGVQFASDTPFFANWARSPKWILQGVASLQVEDTPISGLARSLSFNPIALYIALCGALDGPSRVFLLGNSIN